MTSLSLRRIFAIPLMLMALTLVGLISALVADGWGDGLSWLCLGILPAITAWYWRR